MFKRMMMIMTLISAVLLSGCQTADILTGEEMPNKDWAIIEESALGTQLNIYTTVSDDGIKAWLSGEVANRLMSQYEMTVSVKRLEIEDVLATLDAERTSESADGSIDLLLLKDDDFTKLMNASYLYEEITGKLPNYGDKINTFDWDVQTEHGTPLEGYGIPYGREQLVLLFDEDVLETAPVTTEELQQFLAENKKVFTYADPTSDKTGAEFYRSIVLSMLSEEDRKMVIRGEVTSEELKVMVKPAIDYLMAIDPYLLKNQGKYFKRQSDIDAKFKAGELYFSMTRDFGGVEDMIDEELYPDGAKSFILESGTISDTLYLAVPFNAANKSGALVALNDMLSFDHQLTMYDPKELGLLTIFDLGLLSEEDAMSFEDAPIKRSTMTVEALQAARYPEVPMSVQAMLNDIWKEHFID